MTAIPSKTQFTASTVTEGQFKSAIEQLHDYLTGLMGSDGTAETARAGLEIPGRNVIIGGDFSTNPWQRGTSFANIADGDYTADRWRISYDGTPDIDVDRAAVSLGVSANGAPCRYGATVTVNSLGSRTYVRWGQRLPRVHTLANGEAMFSATLLASTAVTVPIRLVQHFGTGGSPSSDVTTAGATDLSVTTSYQDLTSAITVPSVAGKVIGSNNNDRIEIQFDLSNLEAGDSVTILNAQLEYGTASTRFEQLPTSEVLQRCQHYYRKSYSQGTDPGAVGLTGAGAHAFEAAWVYATGCNSRFPPMRAAPTVTWYSTNSGSSGNVYLSGATTTDRTISSTTATSDTQTGFPEVSSAPSANTIAYAHWTAEAEL